MRAVVLNSVQSKRLVGSDPWLRATIRAVDHLASCGHCIVASVGTSTWEVVLWRAALRGAPVELICPLARGRDEGEARETIASDFGVAPWQAHWTFLRSARSSGRCKDTWAGRDELAWRMAELVVPVSVRPGGRWQSLLANRSCPVRIEPQWQVPWVRKGAGVRWDGVQLEGWPEGFDSSGGALIHFTRCGSGPWPGERAADFYAAVARGGDNEVHDAWHTLERMLKESRIRGSSRHIRGQADAVCFTAMPLRETTSLFRWRRRYARPSFEPFGVALSMGAAIRLGAKPVRYDRGGAGAEREPGSLWRQGAGKNETWLHEQEWRVAGDVDLGQLARHEAALIVPTQAHAEQAREWCRFPVLAGRGSCWSGARSRDATRPSAHASNLA